MKKFLIPILLTLLYPLFAIPQNDINTEVFNAVISEILKFHYDGNFRQKYAETITSFRQRAEKSVNSAELGRILNAFFRQLSDSHFNIIVPSSQVKQSVLPLKNDIKLLESNGKVLICECPANSVFKCGDELLAINNETPDRNNRIGAAIQLAHKLQFGIPGNIIKADIIRNNRKMSVQYTAERLTEMPIFFKLGEMPLIPENYNSKIIDRNTGYISFNHFTPHAVQMLKKDINSKFRNIQKLIIDLRNNSGGLILMGVNMASFLSGKKVDFGKMIISGQPLTPKSYPQKNRFYGKVFILVDRNSYSTAEIFAQSMHDSGSAVVIGEKTAGMCLPSVFISLPHGFRLQTVAGDYISSSGKRLEGKGFTPPIVIKNTPDSLKSNRDMLIEYVRKF